MIYINFAFNDINLMEILLNKRILHVKRIHVGCNEKDARLKNNLISKEGQILCK